MPQPVIDIADTLCTLLDQSGAAAWGITSDVPIAPGEVAAYNAWTAKGCHGEMDYLTRYPHVRSHPALLLDAPGAPAAAQRQFPGSVICCAFPYFSSYRGEGDCLAVKPMIASYALGEDYHDVLRRRLWPVKEWIEAQGHVARICVDTAPVRERLLAKRAGVGFIGRNGMLIVPGVGSYVFLAEVVTTMPLPLSEPSTGSCEGCGRCIRACPGRAIGADGTIDCRRCISYLTIEYRGDTLPADTDLDGRIYGCDTCQAVCPHNRCAPQPLSEFAPRAELLKLSVADVATLDEASYRDLTRHSAMRRAKLPQLLRNLRHINSHQR